MLRILIKARNIVTVNNSDDYLTDSAVEITDGIITKIDSEKSFNLNEYDKVFDYSDFTLIPGFVQTHVHLCQTLFRGLADDLELLDWLQNRIFPFENSHTYQSLKSSAQIGLYELQAGGTTTILDMGTINHHEAVFEQLGYSGMRAYSGKCMVDENDLLPIFKETKDDSLKKSYDLAKEFHRTENGRLNYAFAPRFVLSCSEEMLKETYEMMFDFPGTLYHTHSSENKGEIAAVKSKTGMENIEYFNSIGVLGERTVLAHGIHVNDKEIEILKSTKTRIAHCPSANLKLASGIAIATNTELSLTPFIAIIPLPPRITISLISPRFNSEKALLPMLSTAALIAATRFLSMFSGRNAAKIKPSDLTKAAASISGSIFLRTSKISDNLSFNDNTFGKLIHPRNDG